jgi:protocatechuate 3,4-dioxygenase beta subunit
MQGIETSRPSRRAFLRACVAMPISLVLAACAGADEPAASAPSAAPAEPTPAPPTAPAEPTPAPPTAAPTEAVAAPTEAVAALPPTPACDDDDELTPAQTEGPYFTPSSPERSSLIEAGISGTRLLLSGAVVDTACRPLARALLDFWQADDAGSYDNQGYRLRGHVFSDDQGRFSLETILPGLYPGRTRHIHVKVQAPGGPILTTQLYFPGEPANARDGIYQPELELALQDQADGKAGQFTFVLAV